jgi:hypothetical protein
MPAQEYDENVPTTACARIAATLRLLCDVQTINEQALRSLGPLPSGGLPVQPKRKPNLPNRFAPCRR